MTGSVTGPALGAGSGAFDSRIPDSAPVLRRWWRTRLKPGICRVRLPGRALLATGSPGADTPPSPAPWTVGADGMLTWPSTRRSRVRVPHGLRGRGEAVSPLPSKQMSPVRIRSAAPLGARLTGRPTDFGSVCGGFESSAPSVRRGSPNGRGAGLKTRLVGVRIPRTARTCLRSSPGGAPPW